MKQTLKIFKFSLVLLFLFISFNISLAVTYYSQGNLPPNVLSSWNTNPNGGGSAPTAFNTAGNTFIIQNGDTMVSTAVFGIISANTTLQIDSGGVLQGNFAVNLSSSSTFVINGGGLYIHNLLGTGIFGGTEVFARTSTVELRNWQANFLQNINWGNLRFNAAGSINNNLNFGGNLKNVQGNLEVLATGSPTVKEIQLTNDSSYSLTIGGDFIVSGGTLELNSYYRPSLIRCSGSFIQTGGSIKKSGDISFYDIYFNGKNKILNQSGGTLTGSNLYFLISDSASYKFTSNFTTPGVFYTDGTLDLDTFAIKGYSFSLTSNSTLKIGSPQGIQGNVQTTNFSFPDYSTLEFNGRSQQITGTLPSQNSYNVRISNTSGTVILSASSVLRRNLIIDQGATLDIGNYNLTGSGNFSLLSGTGTLKLNGNISSQMSGFNINMFRVTGTFEFAGASQIVPSGGYSKLKVTGSGITLNGNVIVNDTLFLQSGNVTLGANNITAKVINGGSASSYIVTDGAGALKINNVAGPVLFPVGRTSYNPLIINNTGTADNFTVSVQDVIDNPTYNNTHTVQKQWNIAEGTAGGSNASLTFQWNTADEGSMFARNSGMLYAGHWNGTMYDLYPAALGGANDVWTATVTGISSFSPFIIGDDGALPVELASFTSTVNGGNVKLSWSTVSEVNNSGFDIERKSVTGTEWKKVGSVKGAGNSNELKKYSFSESGLAAGKYNYRLKQIDYNGNFEYHSLANEVIIGIPSKFMLSQNYPNPFNPVTRINYELPLMNFVSLKIYDIQGKEVMTLVNEVKDAGYYSVTFDAKNLSSGMYFYKLSSADFTQTKKMVLIK